MKLRTYLCLIVCLIFVSSLGLHSQIVNYSGIALLVPKHVYVRLYDSPNGNVVDSIMSDTVKEDFVSICIKQIQNDYAEVLAVHTFDSIKDRAGWILLKYIGINPNTFSGFNLYASPNEGSAIIDSVPNSQWGDLYPILQCVDDWLYIKTYNDNKWREGWMAPEDQCDNPYSTCN